MKNSYCNLTSEQIKKVPERFLGFMLSPFQYNLRNEMVHVPEDTFQEMIDIIAEYALQVAAATPPSPSTAPEGAVTDYGTPVDERAAFEANLPKSWSRQIEQDEDGGIVYVSERTLGAWIGWGLGRHELASRPAEVDDEDLPLPESKFCAWLQHGRVWNAFPHGVGDKARWDRGGYWSAKGFDREPLFTAEQYRQGQRDAVAAYKRQQVALQQLADQAQELDMGYGAAPSHTTNKEK